jgi:hypothetical protein
MGGSRRRSTRSAEGPSDALEMVRPDEKGVPTRRRTTRRSDGRVLRGGRLQVESTARPKPSPCCSLTSGSGRCAWFAARSTSRLPFLDFSQLSDGDPIVVAIHCFLGADQRFKVENRDTALLPACFRSGRGRYEIANHRENRLQPETRPRMDPHNPVARCNRGDCLPQRTGERRHCLLPNGTSWWFRLATEGKLYELGSLAYLDR